MRMNRKLLFSTLLISTFLTGVDKLSYVENEIISSSLSTSRAEISAQPTVSEKLTREPNSCNGTSFSKATTPTSWASLTSEILQRKASQITYMISRVDDAIVKNGRAIHNKCLIEAFTRLVESGKLSLQQLPEELQGLLKNEKCLIEGFTRLVESGRLSLQQLPEELQELLKNEGGTFYQLLRSFNGDGGGYHRTLSASFKALGILNETGRVLDREKQTLYQKQECLEKLRVEILRFSSFSVSKM